KRGEPLALRLRVGQDWTSARAGSSGFSDATRGSLRQALGAQRARHGAPAGRGLGFAEAARSRSAGEPGRGGSERQAPAWHPPMREPSAAEHWHPPLKLPPRYTSAELAEGEEEIALLREVYGNVLNASAKLAYAHFTDKRWQYRTEEY